MPHSAGDAEKLMINSASGKFCYKADEKLTIDRKRDKNI